jgi:hypothetical protein
LAEVKRKTEDFKEGISILNGLRNAVNFPTFYVEKLGRIAALLNEYTIKLGAVQKFDSVKLYLDSAIILARELGLKNMQAILYK